MQMAARLIINESARVWERAAWVHRPWTGIFRGVLGKKEDHGKLFGPTEDDDHRGV
jgi:hypothetical protein